MAGKTRLVLFVFLVCVVILHLSSGARRIDAHERAKDTMRKRATRQLRERATEAIDVTVKEFMQLRKDEQLRRTEEASTAQGTTIRRLQETYQGIPVMDAVVSVETENNGKLTGDATGTFVQDIEQDVSSTKPGLTKEEALQIAISVNGDKDSQQFITNPVSEIQIYLDDSEKARLAYTIDYLIITEDIQKRPAVILDANTGEMLGKWDMLAKCEKCRGQKYVAAGGNEKIGQITYGTMPYCLDMKVEGSLCYLENEYVKVVDLGFSSDIKRNNEPANFSCGEGYGDSVNGAFSPAVDAFFYGNVVSRMFREWFMMDPLEDQIVLKVHFGHFIEAAFFNGDFCTFGDGNETFYPLVSLDVVGHEIAHGVTQRFSKLIYTKESGGINEAFSDIIGEASEEYLKGNDFQTGTAVMKGENESMRYFESPESDNESISHVSDFNGMMDVHYSSGIYRRVFYVVSKEQGMSVKDATRVFLHANRMYWHHWSSFASAACDVLKSAYDLGYTLKPFEIGFRDVGISPCNIKEHIRGITYKRHYENIVVSESVKPVFSVSIPDSILLESNMSLVFNATSRYGDVIIKASEDFLKSDNCTEARVLAEGVSTIELALPELPMFYIQLEQPEDDHGVWDDVTLYFSM